MYSTRASSKGQMVIPKGIRQRLRIRPGTRLSVEPLDDQSFKVRLASRLGHRAQVEALAGSLHRPGMKYVSEAETNRRIGAMLVADDERIKRAYRRRKSR